MLPTQDTLDLLADRIERAFLLRCGDWYRGCSTPRVWSVAATILWETHGEDPKIPLDPELFVASQPFTTTFADPWGSLALPEAGRRYKRNVRRIIRRLRDELRRELRLIDALVRRGRRLGVIADSGNSRLSPLSLYVAAHRAARPDIAERLQHSAVEQHNCCPLYRSACLDLMPAELYPVERATYCGGVASPPHMLSGEIRCFN